MAAWIPILTFHDLKDHASVISYPPELFRRGVLKLHERGYQTVSLLEVADCLRSTKPFPERAFAITFDDGYESVYQEAFPVLQRYHMSATVFLAVGKERSTEDKTRLPSLEGRPMLNWQEIREMHRFGIEFGAHTCTHPNLTRLSPKQIDSEMGDSKKIIADGLSFPVRSFAYPYGRYNHHVLEMARSYFVCACSDRLGLVAVGKDPYTLKRVDAYYLRSEKLFDLMLTGLFPWYIRTLSIPRGIRRLIQNRLRW